VFIVYAVVLGVAAGFLLGGRLERLGAMRFRWPWLALAGLAAQVVLFSGAVDDRIGGAGPALYVASTAVVLAAVLANLVIPGLALVALGAVSNMAAIVANGGYMPADRQASAVAGLEPHSGFSNSVVTDAPALRPLTDIFAIPEGIPFANVFSIGDVLIAAGIGVAIAAGMRRTQPDPSAPVVVRPGNSPE
jgi:hypothetical protein